MITAIEQQRDKIYVELMNMRLRAIHDAGLEEEFFALCEIALKRMNMLDEYIELLEEWTTLDDQLSLESHLPAIEQRAD